MDASTENQVSKQGSNTTQINQQQLPRIDQCLMPHTMGQKPKVPEKMSKARALTLAHTFKRWLAVASIVGFGTFGGLFAFHQVGTTTSQSTQSSSGSLLANILLSSYVGVFPCNRPTHMKMHWYEDLAGASPATTFQVTHANKLLPV